MRIRLNGKDMVVKDGLCLSELLSELAISCEKAVVEHNRKILLLKELPLTFLKDGDNLEVLSFVGGG